MLITAGALIIWAAMSRGEKEEAETRHDFAMGSAVTLTLYGEKNGGETSAKILQTIRNLDEQVISWRAEGSELAVWNRDAKAGEYAQVSRELYEAVSEGKTLWEKSGGALDLTLRPVLDVWGIEDADPDSFQVPSEEQLRQVAEHCGMGEIQLNGQAINRAREDIRLDLGALGKGYALDVVYRYLTEGEYPLLKNEGQAGDDSGLTGGVLAVGGSVMVFGSKSDGNDFKIGIRDPEGQPEDIIGTVSLPGGTGRKCISTSGGYEKYVRKDGVVYHHIIDPKTLKPSEGDLVSVTVVCENGLISDGLSTACFILGEEKAKELLSEYGAEGILIRKDGSIYCTPGIGDRFQRR